MKPVRIQRKRTKGFDMQAESRAVNGLECVYVGRPTQWGNPFDETNSGSVHPALRFACEVAPLLDVSELRGKNLACWCRLDQECHADVLLEIANAAAKGE